MSTDIRLLSENERGTAKALWRQAFGDSDAFIDWYFDNKILPGNSLAMFDGTRLVSIVHMIPYTIRVQGWPLESAFIAGAATAKDRRGQGLMRTLLLETLALLKSRGILLTHLYPFSHAFYEAFGWTAYTYMKKVETGAAQRGSADIVETDDTRIIATLYARKMAGFDGYVVRGEREWRWRLGELYADGGRCAVLYHNGEPRAYALYYPGREKAEIIEMVCTCEADADALAAYVLEKGAGRVQYFLPACRGDGAVKHGMARVVDARGLLEAFGAQKLLDTYDIKDSFAPWNNTRGGAGETMDIGELAQLVHNGRENSPFPLRRTCIFEAY